MKNALALALVLLLAACGGGGDSAPAEQPRQSGSTEVVALDLPSGVSVRELTPTSYINNTGADTDVDLTLTVTQTLSAQPGFQGTAYVSTTMSVILNNRLLVGPPGSAHPESGPRVSQGHPVTWSSPATWRVHLNPGDRIDAHIGVTFVLPDGSAGPLLLESQDLALSISAHTP